MLEKLNQYRHTLTLPLRQKPAQNQFRFEWVDNLKELQEVQRFRATQFSINLACHLKMDWIKIFMILVVNTRYYVKMDG